MDFSRTLQHWYAHFGRTLPWRGIDNPYHIWLSEIILQQTRVEQGRAYYERFTQLFPTVSELAAATEQEVLTAWQGLGYYSRARNLHKAAKLIAASGKFPADYASLRALPGVGDYTAAAVASLAYGLPCAVVDGNVYRVLSRFYGINTPIDTTAGKREFKALADELLDCKNSAAHNQALMDFGAMVCTPRSPKCAECPLHDGCAMVADACNPESYPFKARTTKVCVRHFTYVFVRFDGKILLHRRGAGDIWEGLYEPMLFESDKPMDFSNLQQILCDRLAVKPQKKVFNRIATELRHQLTHRLILAEAYTAMLADAPKVLPEDCLWVEIDELHKYPIPRLVERLWKFAQN